MGTIVEASTRVGEDEASRVRSQARTDIKVESNRGIEVGNQDEEFVASF